MKRCYLGAGMLVILLLFGIFSGKWMDTHHSRLEEAMVEASRQNPREALALAEQTREAWNRKLTAVLADHQYLERAELAFGQLSDAAAADDRAEWTRLCLEIAHIFGTLARDQRLSWENLL